MNRSMYVWLRAIVLALVAVVGGSLLTSANASAQSTSAGCGYGAGGPNASNLCWFNMSQYNDTQARSLTGQQMAISLPGGYTARFTLTSRPVGTRTHATIAPRTVPIEPRFAFGVAGYVGTPNMPALYSAGGTGVELTLSNIQVVDSSGATVTGYSFVIADAENNVTGENFTWTSDKPLELIGVLNQASQRGCSPNLAGIGTTQVTCTGTSGPPGSSPLPLYDSVIVGADTPSRIALSMTTFARSGVAFGILTSKIQVTKSVAGRVRASDSFDLRAASPEGSTIATARTDSQDSATTGELTVLPRTNGASYTLSEAVTPGSGTLLADYAQSWSCTNNGQPDASLPSGSGTSVSVSPEAGDDIECTVTNSQRAAELSLRKTAAQAEVVAGGEATFALEVNNAGPSRATNVTVSDDLPDALIFVSASPGCTEASGTVTCTLSELAADASHTFTVTGTVGSSPDRCLANTATVSSPTPDGDADDNRASTCVPIRKVDLALRKTADTSPVVPGAGATFALEVTNNGPDSATGVTVSDELPDELAFVSASAGCSEAGGTVTCTVAELAPGAKHTFTVTGTVAASLDHCLSNTATVSSATPDTNSDDNTATICVPIQGEVDLSITDTPSITELSPGGGQVMYTLVVQNDGPSDATGVTVTDPLADGLTLAAANTSQGSCSTAGDELSCSLGRLAAGGSAQILLTAHTWATPGAITDTAAVRGDQVETDPGDNSDSATVSVQPPAALQPSPSPEHFDLQITKRASAARVTVGQPVTYRIVVSNRGAVPAPGLTLTDTLNVPGAVRSVRTTAGSCTRSMPISCELGTIPAGGSATITVVVKPRRSGGRLRNAASAMAAGTEAQSANNLAAADVRARKVGLVLSKTASRATVHAGETIAYRIRVRNPTAGEARDVKVCDRLPSGLGYVSSKPTARRSGRQRCWTIERLGARKSRTFRVTVRVARGAIGRTTNTATVRSPDAISGVRARDTVRVRGIATPVTG